MSTPASIMALRAALLRDEARINKKRAEEAEARAKTAEDFAGIAEQAVAETAPDEDKPQPKRTRARRK